MHRIYASLILLLAWVLQKADLTGAKSKTYILETNGGTKLVETKTKEVNIDNYVDVKKEEADTEYSKDDEYSGEPKWGTKGNIDYSMKPKWDPKTKTLKHYNDEYYGQPVWGLDGKNWTNGIPKWGTKGNIDYAIEPKWEPEESKWTKAPK